MSEIHTPLRIEGLDIKPPLSGALQIDPKMTQSMSLLMGFWKNKRIPLKCSPSGILLTCSPPLDNILHVPATTDNFAIQGGNIPCSEVLIMGHPDNTGRVWIGKNNPATVNNSWPLEGGDVANFSVTNLNQLYGLIVNNTERIIFAYSV